jgi:TonB family protein
MLLPTLDALGYLHDKGFVHGRIKPSNILAMADHVKLSSDAISAISEGVSGTPKAYDPPEARIGKVSPASDMWSLGMTLAEVLTLQKPTWDAAKRQEPVLPKELDESFRIIIRNCLKLDAENRWTVAQIKSVLEPEKAQAAKVVNTPKSNAWYYLIAAVIAVILVVVIGDHYGSNVVKDGPEQIKVGGQDKPSAAEPPSPPSSAKAKKTIQESGAPKAVPGAGNKTKLAAASAGSGVVQQVLPEVAASARRTITGKIRIRVKVSVGADGNVSNAALDSPSKSNYFNRLAQEAAEKWKFAPAAGEWMVHFGFTSKDTTATAEQLKH